MNISKFFKQYQLGDKPEGFNPDPMPEARNPAAILELLASFVVAPNVIQTSKGFIVGSGTSRIFLNPNNATIELGGLDFTDVPISPNTGLKDGVINFEDNLYIFSRGGGTTVTMLQLIANDQILLNAPGGEYHSAPIVEFDITGAQGSTLVQVTRRGNSPVIKFPNFESPPSTCSVGDITVASGKLYICSAANTWTVVGTQT